MTLLLRESPCTAISSSFNNYSQLTPFWACLPLGLARRIKCYCRPEFSPSICSSPHTWGSATQRHKCQLKKCGCTYTKRCMESPWGNVFSTVLGTYTGTKVVKHVNNITWNILQNKSCLCELTGKTVEQGRPVIITDHATHRWSLPWQQMLLHDVTEIKGG